MKTNLTSFFLPQWILKWKLKYMELAVAVRATAAAAANAPQRGDT
jgi:hypothetical protein